MIKINSIVLLKSFSPFFDFEKFSFILLIYIKQENNKHSYMAQWLSLWAYIFHPLVRIHLVWRNFCIVFKLEPATYNMKICNVTTKPYIRKGVSTFCKVSPAVDHSLHLDRISLWFFKLKIFLEWKWRRSYHMFQPNGPIPKWHMPFATSTRSWSSSWVIWRNWSWRRWKQWLLVR